MAYICTRGIKCERCMHYRWDDDRGQRVCHGKQDEELAKENLYDPKIEDYEVILDYDTFTVVYGKKTHRYFYIPDDDAPRQVILRASLTPSNALSSNVDDSTLASMYDNTCCGEHVDSKGNSTYMWFM